MKKTRFLVLALAVAIMLMGAGYAYWQETLTIENTITTGALEFEFVEDSGEVDVAEFMDEENSYCIVGQDDNEVLIQLAKMYPGAQATVTFDLKNTGTMDAKLKNFKVLGGASEIVAMDYIEIISFKVDDTVIVNSPVGVNLFNNLTTVADLAKGDTAEIELVIGINSAANEDQVLEGREGANAYNFTLIFDGLQWNDTEH